MLQFLLFIPFLSSLLFGEGEQAVFKNVLVDGEKGEYLVEGEVRTEAGVFFYTVEDGHYQYVDETKVTLSDKSSAPFKIAVKIPTEQLPDNATLILNLYERDKANQIVHNYPVILEEFYD
ncbi:intracellular proteinase inhibitor [Robertmurraya yapensis]|uniref:Intracellular proteinase inhibitor n=1 Tax=Bacillus yapensis TaxID=2492960 RepID=A0A3S0IB17_9BACI|nr:intracellular proteinase inhibitor [Bacillus yapensis]TKS95777.1 intracellular proteinase inhibitor [Bacillus yapensis]